MTSLWLFLSKVFVWSYGFYDATAYVLNWVLFLAGSTVFLYWCWTLVSPLGNNKDNPYKSPSKVIRPYYDPEIYKKK